jgi:sugar lactone lactonase YvrE
MVNNPFDGVDVLYVYTAICAWVGERDLAIEQLETVAKTPGGPSYDELRLNPIWDPLRGDPRFEKIVASLAPKYDVSEHRRVAQPSGYVLPQYREAVAWRRQICIAKGRVGGGTIPPTFRVTSAQISRSTSVKGKKQNNKSLTMKKSLTIKIRSVPCSICFHVRAVALVAASVWAMACGAVQAQVAVFATLNRAPGSGGLGSILQYTPAGKQSTFVTDLTRPRGMAFDISGNLYLVVNPVVSSSIQGTILLLTPGGGQTTLGAADPNFFIEGLATDANGNVFAVAQDLNDPNGASTIYEFTPAGLRSTFGSIPGGGFSLAFDSAGNLYTADSTFQNIYMFTPNGTRSVFVGPSAFGSNQLPIGLAFDKFGNLYVSTVDANGSNLPGDAIVMFMPNGTESTFASSLTSPRGIAFDNAGNLYVAEIPNDLPTGDILKFNPAGKKNVLASGLGDGPNGGPEFVISPSQPGKGPH